MNHVAINIIIREWVLGVTFMLTSCMAVMFIVFLLTRAKEYNYGTLYVEFYKSEWARAAIGLTAFIAGVSMRAAWVWMLLWDYERYGKSDRITAYWPIDILAGALTIVGGLCVIREFTPSEWNKWPIWRRPWVLSALLTSAFLAIVHFVI